MNLLLISNSTNAGEAYLDYPKENIRVFLQSKNVKKVLFVPYAGVTLCWEEYESKVKERFAEIGIEVESIHHSANPADAVNNAEAIVVGGGNSFALLKNMQDNGIMEPIRRRVKEGLPYVGWSAGSNMSCPGLYTTNDMPIVEPMSFKALGLVDFQINPHYLDAHPSGHAGETREQRIEEFLQLNCGTYVVGLREGCMLKLEGGELQHIGARSLRIFRHGDEPREVPSGGDLQFLLEE